MSIHYLISGGSCNLCGSQKHLRKDCPLKKGADGNSQRESLVAARNNATGGDDDVLNVESNTESSRAKKMKLERKVVRI
ncbi:unnamed protein product [Onchocerca flexuosa]|uniref:CCHC-type domain-containing protein n=1 Tax=Onchocerca flexuosa TaxID=387005 RepID=A0A183HCE8_9BILA|nr:unnamed protein product [Onchocerca flexuosa]